MSKLLKFLSFTAFAAIGFAQQMPLPATFRGTLPCADCSGIQTTLTLRDDKLFFLRQVYQGKKVQPSWRMGEWELSGQKLTLKEGSEKMYFSVLDSRTLRQLDTQGNPIESAANYNLKRSSNVTRPTESMLLTGMFVYMADAASLKECNTGRNFNVQGGPGYLALERLYTQNRTEAGKPLFVSFYGRLVPSKMEEGPREALSVDRALPYQAGSCAGQAAAAAPADFSGKWMLAEINGATPAGDAWIEIDTAARRVSGNNGCNRMTGAYESSSSGLRFQNFAGTRMACPGGAMALESAVNKALSGADARLSGDVLEIVQGGQVVARYTKAASPVAGFAGKWILAELNGKPPVTTGAFLQVDAAQSRVGGNSGCNSVGGGYTASGSSLKLGNLVGTMMACPGPKMDLERELLKALNGSELRLSGGMLEVARGGAVLAKYQREGAAVPAGGKWVLKELNGSAYSGGEVFFELDPEQKRVAGKSGCNRMMGTYEETAGKFTFGRMAGTRMACPGDAMATEAAVLKAFGGEGRISGNTFELLLDGNLVARFSRQ